MNIAKHQSNRPYRSTLRQNHAEMTRDRILAAARRILDDEGGAEAITFRRVAELGGMTEMTVYRHFPTRADLLRGVWESVNAQLGADIGMPHSLAELQGQHRRMFEGFDTVAATIVASISSPQGREMRTSLNDERKAAFTAIVKDIAPALAPSETRRAAGLLQLLHSAYAWDSLREQWGMSGSEAALATAWLIDLLVENLRRKA